jgi:hypothetical protein
MLRILDHAQVPCDLEAEGSLYVAGCGWWKQRGTLGQANPPVFEHCA